MYNNKINRSKNKPITRRVAPTTTRVEQTVSETRRVLPIARTARRVRPTTTQTNTTRRVEPTTTQTNRRVAPTTSKTNKSKKVKNLNDLDLKLKERCIKVEDESITFDFDIEEELKDVKVVDQTNQIVFKDITTYPPGLLKTTAPLKAARCVNIPLDVYFRRASIVFFAKIEEEFYYFFNIYSGFDRGVKIDAEISDFGGKVEIGETYIDAAISEALEESMGVFNFVGQNEKIRDNSMAVYSTDRALIMIMCPIIINNSLENISKVFTSQKAKIMENKNNNFSTLMEVIYDFKYPEIVNTNNKKYKKKKFIMRNTKFNPEESTDIIYVKSDVLERVLNNEKVKFPKLLNSNIENDYKTYPKMFSVTGKMLKSLFILNVV